MIKMRTKRSQPDDGAFFGRYLRSARTRANITQEELAARAHVSVKYVSHLETGVRTNPNWQTVAALAKALRMSPGEFFTLPIVSPPDQEPDESSETLGAEAAFQPAINEEIDILITQLLGALQRARRRRPR